MIDAVGNPNGTDGPKDLGADIDESFASRKATEDRQINRDHGVALFISAVELRPNVLEESLTVSTGDASSNIDGHHRSKTPHSGLLAEGSRIALRRLHLEVGTNTHQNRDHGSKPSACVSQHSILFDRKLTLQEAP